MRLLLVFYINTGGNNRAADPAFPVKERNRISLSGRIRDTTESIGSLVIGILFAGESGGLWG